MRSGRPKAELVLSDEERSALERYARRGTVAQQLGLRARIVLRCAAGSDNKTVAQELGICAAVVGKWWRRFIAQRLDGLLAHLVFVRCQFGISFVIRNKREPPCIPLSIYRCARFCF
jgi:FixJ family two-component response regulator